MRILLWLISLFIITVYAADKPSFVLNTNAFLDSGALPVAYTCDGKDISPELDWSNLPAKTETLVLIFSDPTAPKNIFYHWVLYNIPKTTTSLAEGVNPTQMGIGKNSWGKAKYNGPCPPKDSAHTYFFDLYALDTKLNLPANADGQTVVDAMKNHIIGKTQLSTVYMRWLL